MEILIYASLLVLLIVLMANAVASLSHLIRDAKTERTLRASAETALERTAREVRFAEAADTGTSVFDANPGTLVLTSIDPFTETAQTVTISLSGGRITIQKDANPVEYLTSDDETVSSLLFRHITNDTTSESVRTELVIGGKNFYITTVLRRSY